MSTSTITVAILGLRRLGASFGLALKRYAAQKGARHQFEITGWDSSSAEAAAAQKRGAFDTLAPGLAAAAANRDIVLLALPYSEVQSAYRAFAPALRPGAVVLDASPLKGPSLEWAQKALPAEAHMIGITPVVNFSYLFDGLDDAEHASADLFDGGTFMLMPAARAAKDAVELAADLATLVGATPRFADPAEHDGFIALTDALPALLGAAAFHAAKQGQSWDDAQRLTNSNFGRLTHSLLDSHPDDLRDLLLNNRQNTLYHLDNLIRSLQAFRDVLDANQQDALEAALIGAAQAYAGWAKARSANRWGDAPEAPTSSGHSVMSGLLGDSLARRLKRDGNGSSDR